jgi:hypothetical protein
MSKLDRQVLATEIKDDIARLMEPAIELKFQE